MTELRIGTRVEVPHHFKPRGQERQYDRGEIMEINGGFVTVKLDDGRTIYTAIGLLTALDSSR